MSQLAYQVPDAGRKKTILRIPESHTLYLCPNACGRRQGIRALKNGEADRVSFLSFSQADVALGDYVGLIDGAVDAVLDALQPAPRVLTLCVNCVDDFLGTDGEALLAQLSVRHPDVRFLLSRINPIAADVAGPAASGMQSNLYAALEPCTPGERDRGLNVVGTYLAATAGMPELCAFVAEAGVGPVRDIVAAGSFDDYAAMARSALNLSASRTGDAACAAMEERLGIPWMMWHACYDLDEIAARYGMLAAALGVEPPDMSVRRTRAGGAVTHALQVVGDMPLVVDTAASLAPFSLARALLDFGFKVAAVFALHSKGDDRAAEDALAREHPEVVVVRKQGLDDFARLGIARPCLAVGRDAGFLLKAEHMADVYHDEGLFGYAGVVALMDALEAAVACAQEWEV